MAKNIAHKLAATRRTLPIALLRAREVVMERFRPLLHEHDVTEQQWRVLRVLQEHEELDATELAQAASVLAPSLSRILKTLETKGFIKTVKDPQDGRRNLIRLREKGEVFVNAIAPASSAIYADIEAKIGKDNIEALLNDLESIVDVLADDA